MPPPYTTRCAKQVEPTQCVQEPCPVFVLPWPLPRFAQCSQQGCWWQRGSEMLSHPEAALSPLLLSRTGLLLCKMRANSSLCLQPPVAASGAQLVQTPRLPLLPRTAAPPAGQVPPGALWAPRLSDSPAGRFGKGSLVDLHKKAAGNTNSSLNPSFLGARKSCSKPSPMLATCNIHNFLLFKICVHFQFRCMLVCLRVYVPCVSESIRSPIPWNLQATEGCELLCGNPAPVLCEQVLLTVVISTAMFSFVCEFWF